MQHSGDGEFALAPAEEGVEEAQAREAHERFGREVGVGAGQQRASRRVPTGGVRIEEGEIGHGGVGEQTAAHDDHVVGPTASRETGIER